MSVLIDEDNVLKLRKLRKSSLLIWPNRQFTELADEIGLNLKKLKMGFKKFMAILFISF
jgi:hypothetical protein